MSISVLLLFGILAQQERAIDEIVRVDIVTLDLLALDDQGQPITDLRREDFEIYDHRRKVSIEFFDIVNFDRAEVAKDQDPLMQTMVLLLDLGSSALPTIRNSLQEVRSFLSGLPQPLPLQLLIFSMDYGMVTQGFTTDKVTALDDFTQFEVNFLDRVEQRPNYHEQFSITRMEQELQNCIPRTLNASPAFRSSSAVTMAKNCMRLAFERFSSVQSNRSLAVLGSLENVLLSLAQIEGLKTLYLLSPGISTHPGKSSALLASRYNQSLNSGQPSLFGKTGAGNTPGIPAGNQGGDPLDLNSQLNARAPKATNFSVTPLEKEVQRLAHMALTTRTVIHSFTLPHNYLLDRRGAPFEQLETKNVQVHSAYAGFSGELDEGTHEISRLTGGLHFREDAIGDRLESVMAKTRFYYVLGYAKPERSRKGFRGIRVECKRKGVNLHHHGGYFARKRP